MHVQLTDVFDRCTVFYQKFFKFRALQASQKHHSPRPRPCRPWHWALPQGLLAALHASMWHTTHDDRHDSRLATRNARRATLPVATDVARPGGDDLRRVGDQFHPKVPLRPARAFRAATHRVGDPASLPAPPLGYPIGLRRSPMRRPAFAGLLWIGRGGGCRARRSRSQCGSSLRRCTSAYGRSRVHGMGMGCGAGSGWETGEGQRVCACKWKETRRHALVLRTRQRRP